jgi:hypothetical protein
LRFKCSPLQKSNDGQKTATPRVARRIAMNAGIRCVYTGTNLRFADFPSDFSKLPTVAFIVPNRNWGQNRWRRSPVLCSVSAL